MAAVLSRCDSGLARTEDVICRWGAALPAERYQVTLVPAVPVGGAGPERRLFSAGQLVAAAAWLRQRNARGCHVYARPADARHLLVDDLTEDALLALQAAHRVSAAVRTSPLSFQAWVTVSEEPVPAPLATAAARLLASRYGGDRGAADAYHLGRLPGLCNRKPGRRRADGGWPWVRLLWAEAGVDPGGARLLAEAAEQSLAPLRQGAAGKQPVASPAAPSARPPRWCPGWRLPADEHAEAERRLRAMAGPGVVLDRSRVDWSVARRLLRQGAPEAFVQAVVESGAKAEGLRPSVRARYVARTLETARRALAPAPGAGTASGEEDEDAEEEGRPDEAA